MSDEQKETKRMVSVSKCLANEVESLRADLTDEFGFKPNFTQSVAMLAKLGIDSLKDRRRVSDRREGQG